MHTSACCKIINKCKILNFGRFKLKDSSRTFKHLICFQALSRALKFLFQIQAFSRIFQARYILLRYRVRFSVDYVMWLNACVLYAICRLT